MFASGGGAPTHFTVKLLWQNNGEDVLSIQLEFISINNKGIKYFTKYTFT